MPTGMSLNQKSNQINSMKNSRFKLWQVVITIVTSIATHKHASFQMVVKFAQPNFAPSNKHKFIAEFVTIHRRFGI